MHLAALVAWPTTWECAMLAGYWTAGPGIRRRSAVNAEAGSKGQLKGVHGVWWKVYKTFAFVEFKNADDAKAVMERIHGFQFDGRVVVAHPAVFNVHWPDA